MAKKRSFTYVQDDKIARSNHSTVMLERSEASLTAGLIMLIVKIDPSLMFRMTKSREAIIVLSCWSVAKHLKSVYRRDPSLMLRMTKSREAIIVLSCWSVAKHL